VLVWATPESVVSVRVLVSEEAAASEEKGDTLCAFYLGLSCC
jgi:hypothetical protein